MSNRRSTFIPGLLLILFGAWLLARNLGWEPPGLDVLWPAFPLIFGLAFLVQYLLGGRRDTGLVFVGVAATLVGAFFFAFTLGRLPWSQMDRYWPAFVLIGGVAFLAQWLSNPGQRGLLIPASFALIVGLVALFFTLRIASPELVQQASKLWPLVLILLGFLILLGQFFRGKRDEDEG